MMETSISDFYTIFYIPSMQNLALNMSHLIILGTHHCSNICRENSDYVEQVMASFAHQIQSE